MKIHSVIFRIKKRIVRKAKDKEKKHIKTMHSPVKSLIIVVLALFVVLAMLDAAEAGYRKPPFNG